MYLEEIIKPLYEVGGSLRDELLGKEPKDHDYCTPLLPDEVERLVRDAGLRPFTVGKRFGTVGFRFMGKYVEVTTFRTERYAEGSRKPSVEFTESVTHDLSRRDFTINAMARRGGRLIDPFGGREDLAAGVIRFVGNARERIVEDPLRMLRACRFAAQLGFTVDPDGIKKMRRSAHRILLVSRERWVQELDKLLLSDDVETGLSLLDVCGLLPYVLPEVAAQVGYDQNSDHHDFDLWTHTKMVVASTPPDLALRWAALLHDIGKPATRTVNARGRCNYVGHDMVGAEMARKVGAYMNWGHDRTRELVALIEGHLADSSPLRRHDNAAKRTDDAGLQP